MKYRLTIEEYKEKEVFIQAENARQAWEKAKDAWNNRKIKFEDKEENLRCLGFVKEE